VTTDEGYLEEWEGELIESWPLDAEVARGKAEDAEHRRRAVRGRCSGWIPDFACRFFFGSSQFGLGGLPR
jgi:hypothetical protein